MNSYTRGYSLARIGIIVLFTSTLFGGSFVYMTNRSITQKRGTLYVRIVTAEGLKKGDQVLHRGVQVGEVRSIKFAPTGGVIVSVKVTETLPLSSDASAAMVAADIFGRQTLVLHDGSGRAPLADRDTIIGAPPVSMTVRMDELGRSAQKIIGDTTALLLHQTLRTVSELSSEMTRLSRQSRTVLEREAEQVHRITTTTSTVLDNLAAVTAPERLEPITSDVAAITARLDTTVAAIQQVALQISNPEGTTGRLLADDQLYERMTGSLSALEALLTDVREHPKRYINVKIF